jgi:protein-S-isoprenylcysteine O-methyltransferase Ste14
MMVSESATVSGFIPPGNHSSSTYAITYDAVFSYILRAIQFEEHDLITYFGDAYRQYRQRTPMLLRFLKRPR